MATDLIVYGPVEIPFEGQPKGSAKHIDKTQIKEFWLKPEAESVAEKQGCYVFALRAGKGYTPWYVGKATKSMEQECLGSHQLNHYNAVLFRGLKGTPVLFFVVPDGNKCKVPAAVCDEMETWLIQSGYAENPDMRNSQKTKVPEWTIKGVIRASQGKPTDLESVFKTMMGL